MDIIHLHFSKNLIRDKKILVYVTSLATCLILSCLWRFLNNLFSFTVPFQLDGLTDRNLLISFDKNICHLTLPKSDLSFYNQDILGDHDDERVADEIITTEKSLYFVLEVPLMLPVYNAHYIKSCIKNMVLGGNEKLCKKKYFISNVLSLRK